MSENRFAKVRCACGVDEEGPGSTKLPGPTYVDLERANIRCLKTLGALGDFVFDLLVFVKRTEAV